MYTYLNCRDVKNIGRRRQLYGRIVDWVVWLFRWSVGPRTNGPDCAPFRFNLEGGPTAREPKTVIQLLQTRFRNLDTHYVLITAIFPRSEAIWIFFIAHVNLLAWFMTFHKIRTNFFIILSRRKFAWKGTLKHNVSFIVALFQVSQYFADEVYRSEHVEINWGLKY